MFHERTLSIFYFCCLCVSQLKSYNGGTVYSIREDGIKILPTLLLDLFIRKEFLKAFLILWEEGKGI